MHVPSAPITDERYATGKIGKAYVLGKELWEKIKKRIDLVRGDGTRALGIPNGDSYISVDLPMVASKGLRQIQGLGAKKSREVGAETKRTGLERFLVGSPEKPALKSIFVDFPISVAKGFGKLAYAPKSIGGKPLIDIGQHEVFSTKSFRSDRDVKTFALGVGLIPIAYGAPKIASLIDGYFIGSQSIQTIKTPTPENIGVLTFMGALPLSSLYFNLLQT